MKSRAYKLDVEEAAIISVVISFSLIFLTVFGWAMWGSMRQFVEAVFATTRVGIP